MKRQDEVAVCPSAEEDNCASGLIGSVLSLIISILVWLQEVRCTNISSKRTCPNACDISSALEKLTQFASQAENFESNVTHGKDCVCPVHQNAGLVKEINSINDALKNDDRRASKNAVFYAKDQADYSNYDCNRCCKKLVPPTSKPENINRNVLFEVVAAEVAEVESQTITIELKDTFMQTEPLEIAEKDVETTISCICTSAQVSRMSVTSREHPDTEDKYVQVDVEDLEPVEMTQEAAIKENERNIDTEDEECGCEAFPKAVGSYGATSLANDAKTDYRQTSKGSKSPSPRDHEDEFDEYDDDTTDYTEESEEEYRNQNSRRYIPSTRSKPGQQFCPLRQSAYTRSPPRALQIPARQERPPVYSGYDAPIYTTPYTPIYHDPTSTRYPYQPQPYYQKITRTIHRGSPQTLRKAEYEAVPRERTPRSRLSAECPLTCTGVQERYSQYEPLQSPTRPMSPKVSQDKRQTEDKRHERESPVPEKERPTTPLKSISSKTTPSSTPKSSVPSTLPFTCPAATQVVKECDVRCSNLSSPNTPLSLPPPIEKDEEKKPPPKKCIARCAKKAQEKTKKSTNQSPPVAYMPKQAIPISTDNVQSLEVVEAPSKKAVVADSYMAVEATRRKK